MYKLEPVMMFHGSAGRRGHSAPPTDVLRLQTAPAARQMTAAAVQAATETDKVCSPAEDL